MSLTPWKILESTYIRQQIRIDKCELPSGKIFEPTVFEFRRWANVFAITPNRDVVLIRQYRHGIQKIIWEFPGGVVEDGEDTLAGAKRELLEETGYSAPNVIEVGQVYPNPASQINTLFCYLALDAEKVQVQHLDEAEEIEVHLVPFDEVIAMAKRGELSSAMQVAVLFRVLAHMDLLA